MVASSEYNALALPAMETRRNNLVFTFLMKWLCYSRLSVFVTAKGFLKTWLVLWKIPDTVLVRYATIIPKPTMLPFRCLLPFVSTYLYHQGWILEEVNEK